MGSFGRGDAVGYDDQGAAAGRQGLFGAGLGGGVQVAGGLVQDDDRGRGQVGAGQGDELAFALGEVAAAGGMSVS